MTAKFDAFKAALHALCVEHGVRIHSGDGYDDYGVYVQPGTDNYPAGSHVELEDCIPLTPVEQAAENARQAEQRARWARRCEEVRAASEARYRAAIESGDYVKLSAAIEVERQEQRKKNMRVTRTPDEIRAPEGCNSINGLPIRVYLNEVEILDWIVADDFRRVVETPNGARFGAVRIELEGHEAAEPIDTPAAMPSNSLSGIFVPVPKPVTPAVEAPAAEPASIDPPIVYGTIRTPDGREVGTKMQYFDAEQPICDAAVKPESVERIWADKSQICAEPVKQKHIPARKRKASK